MTLKMAKVAKLVTIQLTTRVVVDENADDETIIDETIPRFIDKILTEIEEYNPQIEDDTEVPYDPELDF
jgi:hypothetical protein